MGDNRLKNYDFEEKTPSFLLRSLCIGQIKEGKDDWLDKNLSEESDYDSFGGLKPIFVDAPDPDGVYRIIYGKQRYKLAGKWFGEGNMAYAEIPAYVCNDKSLSDREKKLCIILAQVTIGAYRNVHDYRMRLIELILELEKMDGPMTPKRGSKRLTQVICDTLGISQRYRRDYYNVLLKGTESLKELIKTDQISLKNAAWVSRQSKSVQEDIVRQIKNGKDQKQVLESYFEQP